MSDQQPVKRRQIVKENLDEVFEAIADKNYTEAERDLLKFVEKQIDLMNNHLLFNGEDIPSFYSLNKSLMDYESIQLALIALHQEKRIAHDVAKERYDDFYANKFVEIKQQQISLGKSAQFTAAREIEMVVRNKYINELSKLKAEIIRNENEYNFTNHLVDSWKNYQFVLGTLSRNAQAEAAASQIARNNTKEFGDENL